VEIANKYFTDSFRLTDLGFLGGSLGWKTRGSLDPKFEEVAFALEASSTGNPKIGEAKTGFGYHIIMVRDPMSSMHQSSSRLRGLLNLLNRSRVGNELVALQSYTLNVITT